METINTYPNGDIKTKERIQDEEWYPDYQAFMEITVDIHDDPEEKLISLFNADYEAIFQKEYPNQEQLKRWIRFIKDRWTSTP